MASTPLRRLTAAASLAALTALIVLRRVRRVEVEGDSMRPTLEPGDRVLVVPARRAAAGDVVAVYDPREPRRLMLKRVTACPPGGYVVHGDNPAASTDSRTFGPVPHHLLRGRAVYRYGPPPRRGRL